MILLKSAGSLHDLGLPSLHLLSSKMVNYLKSLKPATKGDQVEAEEK